MKKTKLIAKSNFFTRILFFGFLFFTFNDSIAQLPFDNRYGSSEHYNDGPCTEFVTCHSIDNEYTYAAVQGLYNNNGIYVIRGMRIKSDGTMLASTFDYIEESGTNYNIFPLKIIPINNNSDYLITGYVTPVSGIYAAPFRPRPFVIKADANLDATTFKIFDLEGFFTDVDELPNQDLLFVGALSYMTTITPAYRSGLMLKTDPTNFTTQWMRFVHANSVQSHHNFQIVEDAIVLDQDYALVCGNVNEYEPYCYPSNLDSFIPRAFLYKINLSDGSFVAGWNKSIISNHTAMRLALNQGLNGTRLIAMALQGEHDNGFPGICFFDFTTGNFVRGKKVEMSGQLANVGFRSNGYYYNDVTFGAHNFDVINNIYFQNNDEDVFISGKFINWKARDNNNGGAVIGLFDIPVSVVYDYSSDLFGTNQIFKTSQQFLSTQQNYLNYHLWNIPKCNGNTYSPFYSASNTLPCLSNCGGNDKYVTITLDAAKYADYYGTYYKEDKPWIYSNDANVCIQHEKNSYEIVEFLTVDPIDIENDDIIVTPEVDNLFYNNLDIDRYILECGQTPPPND